MTIANLHGSGLDGEQLVEPSGVGHQYGVFLRCQVLKWCCPASRVLRLITISNEQEFTCQSAHQSGAQRSMPAAPTGGGTASPADIAAAQPAQEQRACCHSRIPPHLRSHTLFSIFGAPLTAPQIEWSCGTSMIRSSGGATLLLCWHGTL